MYNSWGKLASSMLNWNVRENFKIWFLTLVMLNKLRCHTHFLLSANQITWSSLLIQICILNVKQCRSRSVGFFRSQLILIYTVCKRRTHPSSAGPGLSFCFLCYSLKIGHITFELGCWKRCLWSICRQWRSGSACTSVQSDQGLHNLFAELLGTVECNDIQQRS